MPMRGTSLHTSESEGSITIHNEDITLKMSDSCMQVNYIHSFIYDKQNDVFLLSSFCCKKEQ